MARTISHEWSKHTSGIMLLPLKHPLFPSHYKIKLLSTVLKFVHKIIKAYPDTKRLWMDEYVVSGNLTSEVEYGICSPLEALHWYQCQLVLLNESVILDLLRIWRVSLQHNQSQEPGDVGVGHINRVRTFHWPPVHRPPQWTTKMDYCQINYLYAYGLPNKLPWRKTQRLKG